MASLVPTFVRRVEEERRLNYEMDLLSRIQLDLLPEAPPQIPGYEFAARSLLANEAGGDFYEFLRDERGRLWVGAGDVAGHGYACTIEIAMIKATLNSLVLADQTPARVLCHIDRVLRSCRSMRTFTSLSLLCLDLESGEALLSNAGHPYPLLYIGEAVSEIPLPGLPLGQGPDRTYKDHPVHIPPGAVLIFSSDGLFESMNAQGAPYGFHRVQEILPSVANETASGILEAILADWRRHIGSQRGPDDTSLVVVKRLAAKGHELLPSPQVSVAPSGL